MLKSVKLTSTEVSLGNVFVGHHDTLHFTFLEISALEVRPGYFFPRAKFVTLHCNYAFRKLTVTLFQNKLKK
jgi:hypothetical protein